MTLYSPISFLILFLMVTILSACGKQDVQDNMTDSEPEPELMPDQESWNSEIILTSGGKKIALIKAGHMAKFENKSIILMDEGVEIDFYDDEENHTSHLKSDRGEINERLRDLKAIGNVVVVSDSGETLFTEELLWKNKMQKIISEVDVMIATGTDTIYGIGFESDVGLTSWTIKKPRGKTTRLIGKDDEI